jgi:calcineurin-like phosphoesterase family protein
MTESGLRHIKQVKQRTGDKEELHVTVTTVGYELFDKFAAWFAAQPHPHKVLIAGNHDWVMQAMGSTEISKILDHYSAHPNSIVYLEHEEAKVGPVKAFGSPFSYWGSHNNAFMTTNPDYSSMTKDTHIMVTHYPAILPRGEGSFREDPDIIDAMHRCSTLLHVGGHCHWAHGAYFNSKSNAPCVVASVCDSHWLNPLTFIGKERGDPSGDRLRGGYNLCFPPIVCDLPIPGGPPRVGDAWIKSPSTYKIELAIPFINPDAAPKQKKPTLIFFGPNTDPDAVKRLLPQFEQMFDVNHFDDVAEAIEVARTEKTPYDVCVAKLGSTNNLGRDLLKVLLEISNKTIMVIHSSTAMGHPQTQQALREHYGVQMFVDYRSESKLINELKNFVARWKSS